MDTLVDDFGNIKKIMNTKTKKKIVYSAGEGCPSTGAAASCKAGPAASSSSNRGQPGVDRQTPGRALASGEEDTGASRGGTRRRRGGGGGLDPTTKHRCVLPLRPLRGRSASDLTGGSQGPLRAPPPPPTVATVTRDGASGGGTHLRGIRTPRGCRLPEKGRREARGAGRGADTDAEAAIVAAAAAANRGGADGSDVARSDGTGTGTRPVDEQATKESGKPPHGQG